MYVLEHLFEIEGSGYMTDIIGLYTTFLDAVHDMDILSGEFIDSPIFDGSKIVWVGEKVEYEVHGLGERKSDQYRIFRVAIKD